MTNKEVVEKLYEVVFNGRNLDAAGEFIHENYIQHNPRAQTGLEGFKNFVRDALFANFPEFRINIKRIIAEGDYVAVHTHAIPEAGSRGNAVVDIYRFENGKIAEHWDVIQPVPESTVSGNGMF